MEEPSERPDPVDPIEEREREAGPAPTDAADAIAEELLAIHHASYGRGAEGASSQLIGNTLIVVLDGLELLPNEEFLVSKGREDAVATLRSNYQRAIEPTFRAAVERSLGRRVTAFLSNTHLDPPRFSVEVFRLEPR
jgi:uncharacterized protein YbcI